MTTLSLDGPHWSFALKLYAQPGASEACLVLQDRVGVDINVLLFAVYAAVDRGIALTSHDLQDIDDAVGTWRSDIVLALRSVRRRLKTGPEPAPTDVTEALRTQIKKAELGAEQIEQAALARWLDRHCGQQAPQEVHPRDILRIVVNYFAVRNNTAADIVASSEVQDAISALLQSAEAGTVRPIATSTSRSRSRSIGGS